MILKNISKLIPFLYYLFFLNGLIEVVAEYFQILLLIYITKPLIPIILLLLFWAETKTLPIVFSLVYITSAITNFLFIPQNKSLLFYGIIAFTLHRLLLLFLIKKTLGYVNWSIAVGIAALLFSIFSYLFLETSDVPENSFNLIVFHVFLV